MRTPLIAAGLLLALTACESSATSQPLTSAPAAPSTAAQTPAISANCKLAVLDWSSAAQDIQADAVFGAADHVGDHSTETTANRVKTYCPAPLAAKVADANWDLALAEAHAVTGRSIATAKAQKLLRQISAISDAVS